MFVNCNSKCKDSLSDLTSSKAEDKEGISSRNMASIDEHCKSCKTLLHDFPERFTRKTSPRFENWCDAILEAEIH
jgi:hypothetical protein